MYNFAPYFYVFKNCLYLVMNMSNESIIWNYFISKGKIENPYGVAGLMGNLYAESGLNPTNLQNSGNKKFGLSDEEYTSRVDNGTITKSGFVKDGYGYGLAQWTYYTRKQKLYNYCKSNGTGSIGDINSQLDFLWNELLSYTSVLKVLKSAKTIQEASDIVLTKYEKPANQGDSVKKKRADFGKKIFDRQTKTDSNNVISETKQASSMPTLRNGDRGDYVKQLQQLLISIGYDLGKFGADGKFGDKTEVAVKHFQKKNDLTVDGIVGKRTWAKLL